MGRKKSENKNKIDIKIKTTKEEDTARRNSIDKMLEIMDMKDSKFPTFLTKKIEELYKYYSYREIEYAILKLEDKLIWANRNKEFKDVINKINYLIAIIKNNISEYKKELKNIQNERKIMTDTTDLSVINTNSKTKINKIDMTEYLD